MWDGATVWKGSFLERDLECGMFVAVSCSSLCRRDCEMGCCHFNVIQIPTIEGPKCWEEVMKWTKDCRKLGENPFGEEGKGAQSVRLWESGESKP